MVDDLVARVLISDALVPDPLVGVDSLRLAGDVLPDVALGESLGPIPHDTQTDFSAALSGSDHGRVIGARVAATTGPDATAADKRLVHFHVPT